jgi:transcriptional regulator with XRE-family HTH domain
MKSKIAKVHPIKRELNSQELAEAAALKTIYRKKKKESDNSITYDDLAESLGISSGAVGHYFNGVNALNAKIAAGFAAALEISVGDFSKRLAKEISAMASMTNSKSSANNAQPQPTRKDDAVPLLALNKTIIEDWCKKNNVICTILRLPLLVGKNPPGNLGAMIKGIRQGYYMNIGTGDARKSMVLAEDVARFILPASRVGGTYNLSDGEHPSFNQLSKLIAKQVNQKWIINIPFFLAKILAFAGDIIGPIIPINTDKLAKITSTLTFDDTLARAKFGWSPKPIFGNFRI